MLRRLYNKPAVYLLAAGLLAAPAGRAQNPTAPAAPASLPAQMWAATARYVYHDDPSLRPIVEQLDATIQEASISAFNTGLANAVKLEQAKLKGQKNLEKFQGIVGELQRKNPDWATLNAAIIDRLDDNKQRMADPARQQGLEQLRQQLNALAMNTSVAPATAPAAAPPTNPGPAAAGTPAVPVAEAAPAPVINAPVPTPWTQWLALGLAGLSLGALATLWNKHANLSKAFKSYRERHHQAGTANAAPDISGQVKREVERQLNAYVAQLPGAAPTAVAPVTAATEAAVPPAGGAPEAEAVAAAPAPPPPRIRTQYVQEAPFNRTFRSPTDHLTAYSIFAIESTEQQPDLGTFTVTGNQVNHIRNHRSVLDSVCEYSAGFPAGGETRLVVEQPGQVRRLPDGNWEVTQPARVHFEA